MRLLSSPFTVQLSIALAGSVREVSMRHPTGILDDTRQSGNELNLVLHIHDYKYDIAIVGQKLFTMCGVPGNSLLIIIFFHVLRFMLKTRHLKRI